MTIEDERGESIGEPKGVFVEALFPWRIRRKFKSKFDSVVKGGEGKQLFEVPIT